MLIATAGALSQKDAGKKKGSCQVDDLSGNIPVQVRQWLLKIASVCSLLHPDAENAVPVQSTAAEFHLRLFWNRQFGTDSPWDLKCHGLIPIDICSYTFFSDDSYIAIYGG